MGMYVLTTAVGRVHVCSDACFTPVWRMVVRSADMVAVEWVDRDLDVFCSGCRMPIGERRLSTRLLTEALTPTAWDAYRAIENRSPAC